MLFTQTLQSFQCSGGKHSGWSVHKVETDSANEAVGEREKYPRHWNYRVGAPNLRLKLNSAKNKLSVRFVCSILHI